MGSRDRPFPHGGLPLEESRLYKMAFDLAYRKEYLQEIERGDGQGSQTAKRQIGKFYFEVEYHITFPLTVTRYTVMVWYEDHLVFHAWCSKASRTDELVGLVVTCEDGPWKYHLRKLSEFDEKF